MRKLAVLFGLGVASALSARTATATDWLQFGFDASHSGTNPAERLLTKSNVASVRLQYSITLPQTAEGAPLLLTGVATASNTKDLLFLTLNDGTLLALDASNGATVWSKRPADTDPCAFFTVDKPCVTASSPALDPNRQFVYSYAIDGFVHKYNVGDGSEVTTGGWPQVVTLKPDLEQVSSALTIATTHNAKTYLYVTTSGASWLPDDSGDYQGHVTAIDLGAGTQVTFNVVCSTQGSVHFVKSVPNPPVSATPDCLQQTVVLQPGNQTTTQPTGDGGIWGRAGVVYDPLNDEIYVSTGNGIFNNGGGPYVGSDNWGDSVVALPAALDSALTAPLDSYTPSEFDRLMVNDTDLGSTSIALLPAPAGSSKTHIGVQSGKDGNLRILDLDNLNGSGVPGGLDGHLYEHFVPQINEVKTQPLAWINPKDGSVLLIVTNNFGVSGSVVVPDPGNANVPMLDLAIPPSWVNYGTPISSATTTGGTSPVIANDILYYVGGSGVQALDPASGTVLWVDTHMGTADSSTPSRFHKQSLIVVDNHIYVSDRNNMLWVYVGDDIFNDDFE